MANIEYLFPFECFGRKFEVTSKDLEAMIKDGTLCIALNGGINLIDFTQRLDRALNGKDHNVTAKEG